MLLNLDNLPDDTALLHQLVREMTGLVEHRDTEIAHLQQIIKQLQRARFGRRSEQLDPDQMALALEERDTDVAETTDRRQAPPPAEPARRKPLPDHLPREEHLLDVEDGGCARCGACPTTSLDRLARISSMPIWKAFHQERKRSCTTTSCLPI